MFKDENGIEATEGFGEKIISLDDRVKALERKAIFLETEWELNIGESVIRIETGGIHMILDRTLYVDNSKDNVTVIIQQYCIGNDYGIFWVDNSELKKI